MSTEFKREERYIVFKMSDLGNSLKGDEIRRLARECAEQRRLKGKKPLECVVVEKDWPEYEPTWRAIEARVTGAQPALEGSAVQTAARIMNVDLIRQRDELRAKVEQGVPREAIDKMLTQLMDIAVSNGANSVSMPDEYVEVAAWLCGIPAKHAPSAPEFCPCCGNVMRACMMCPNEDCNAVTATAEQSKYNKQHAVARKASGEAAPEAKP